MHTIKAEQLARKLRAEEGDALLADVVVLAERHGVAVREGQMEESVSGMLVVKERGAVIGVNAKHHPNRQRFTVAHELGHYFLHREEGRVFVDAAPVFFRDGASAEGDDWQEVEANAFAAELLMPKDMLVAEVRDAPVDAFDDLALRRLAARFGVSVQALTIRLTRLGLISA